jgi:ribosomal protein S12 methylthiotransferase
VKDGLAELLEKITNSLRNLRLDSDQSDHVKWIRIMYAYPGYVTDRLINVMASNSYVLPYLDIPLQHAHPDVLRRMRRPANIDWIYATLKKMRSAMPELALRTTFIVGYPGETEQEFQTLLDFVQEIRFDRLGAFQFSFEPGTASEVFGDTVKPELKQERWERLMQIQQAISLEKNQAFVGRTLDVLIEGHDQNISLGRTYRDAPEIDGLVIVEGNLPIGSLVPVKISGAMPYDLSGTPIDSRQDVKINV